MKGTHFMTRSPRRTALIASGLLAAIGLGAGGGAALTAELSSKSSNTTVVRQVTVGSGQPTASKSTLSIADIYKSAYKGVVEIMVTTSAQASPFGGSQSQRAQGSGWVYDTNGDIVTNDHVVSGAQSISVKFWNGSIYKAKVVGSDASTDLAVIKVDAPSSLFSPLALGDSSKLSVGDGVVAIGSPFGLEETVTSGIVSALHRQMNAPNNFTINDSIQTDAAINHGNSGGPLLNAQGEVIGVNAQIKSESGGNDGVGFAIPSSTVRPIVTQLLGSGKVEHAYLGVSVKAIPASVASSLKLVGGVEVALVRPSTPALKAGLHGSTGTKVVDGQSYPTGGDVITALDGAKMTSEAQLQSAVDAKHPGDTISITYFRAGKSHTVQVKLSTRPPS
jgi:S1-C subfamily serine protease